MIAVRQKPSRDVNFAQEECGILGHQAPPAGITPPEQSRAGNICCSTMVWKRGGGGGVDERRRSGGEQKTKTLALYAMLCSGKHERIYRHI